MSNIVGNMLINQKDGNIFSRSELLEGRLDSHQWRLYRKNMNNAT
jgi:hypothetical protein